MTVARISAEGQRRSQTAATGYDALDSERRRGPYELAPEGEIQHRLQDGNLLSIWALEVCV